MAKAKPKKQKTTKAVSPMALPQNAIRVFREVGLYVFLLLLLYMVVSLLSFNPNDPGPNNVNSGGNVMNLGGPVGAWLADFMTIWFGRMSYLLVILLAIVVCRRMGWLTRLFGTSSNAPRSDNADNADFWRWAMLIGGLILCLMGACALENMYFPLPKSYTYAAGGILGSGIASIVSGGFGIVGGTLIALAMFFAGFTMLTSISWFAIMDWLGYQVYKVIEYLQAAFLQFKEKRAASEVKKQRETTVKEFRENIIESKPPPQIVPQPAKPAPSKRVIEEKQATVFSVAKGDLPAGTLPSLSLLEPVGDGVVSYSAEELEVMSNLLVKKLSDFNVTVTVEAIQPGPVVTRFEIDPAPGVKASQIVGLSSDLARSLSVISVRVVENIPGKTVIGIEIPNQNREIVRLIEGIASAEYEQSTSPLTLVLGKDIAGNAMIADISKMPHVLIAGTTGSGKSVCINALIISLVYKSTPEQVRMIMVDPKFLELSVYDGIPHLLAPVVTDMSKAANALRWCIVEMDRRFRLMASTQVRNISGLNKKIAAAAKAGEALYDPEEELEEGQEPTPLAPLPYIVVVVDELADLMMVVGKKIEEIIIRIAQRARAAGIHLVLATQRPSVDVVTGLIKANVPTRIAFQVSSRADSRTVLDQMGAEQLLGQGDMLYLPPGSGFTTRVHGSFVSDEEVNAIVAELKRTGKPDYIEAITTGEVSTPGGMTGDYSDGDGEGDELFDQAVRFVTESRKASISSVQRQLRVGYNRAARMIESMEEAGIVSAADHGKREVLAPPPPED